MNTDFTLRVVILLTTLFFARNVFSADLTVTVKGKAPGAEMNLKSSKVPTYSLVEKKTVRGKTDLNKVKSIPRLNIGEEDQLKAEDITPLVLPADMNLKPAKVIEGKPVKKIVLDKAMTTPVKPLANSKPLIEVNSDKKLPEVPAVPEFKEPTYSESSLSQKKIEDLTKPQIELLNALILLESKKEYPIALGLFADLLKSEGVKTDANYQLALTAKALNLYSEYRVRMLQILNDKDREWQKRAAINLAANAAEGDEELVSQLDPKIESMKIELTKADQYQINRAKYYLHRKTEKNESSKNKEDLTKAFSALDEIAPESNLAIEAGFLKSLVLYRGGQFQEALSVQEKVLNDLQSQRPDSELRSIVALTMARLQFQMGQYKDAFKTYLKVDKSNPEWLQAMIEQAWTQIMSQDYEGAAGNMFSLHTDFFKKAFQPESYVVRTVGYLNLCQFGDGAKVVHDFKRKYAPALKRMQDYKAKTKENIAYYDTIKSWIKSPEQKVVDGLPREFIFALTRHPSFIDEQKNLNSLEDQIDKINQVGVELAQYERKIISSQSEAAAEIAKLKERIHNTPDEGQKNIAKGQIADLEAKIAYYKLQLPLSNKARNALKPVRLEMLARLDKEKATDRDHAGLAIKTRYNQMLTKLTDALDQSEVLQYELYSGAGEHLRYQLAGGDVNKKARPELKADSDKAINWEFSGEIWEDEIGHFRSGLQNVCAPEDK